MIRSHWLPSPRNALGRALARSRPIQVMLLLSTACYVTLRQIPQGHGVVFSGVEGMEEIVMMSRFLTAEQTADLLQTDTGTLRRLAREGRIPATKIGRQWRFDEGLLREWVREASLKRQGMSTVHDTPEAQTKSRA